MCTNFDAQLEKNLQKGNVMLILVIIKWLHGDNLLFQSLLETNVFFTN